ncbi:MAG: pyridoxal phosphate-dependent aminotransferase [Planctomycetota bacterium]|nr:MAG: pyridoxal phosphate-dependent aminotransferase [Planctomycetota bacterium]
MTHYPTHTPILLSPPHLSGEEKRFVDEAFRTNWIAPLGPNVDGFEREMSEHLGVAQGARLACCATSSGTAAIHLGLILLGVKAGDVVLCSDFTFVASANPIRQLGAEPVFVDSDETSWNMSPVALRRAIETLVAQGRHPRACIAVDLYGQGCDYAALQAICDDYDIPILEDAAESLGASVHGRACGTFGRMAALSFNGNKIITTSGGGMLVSTDASLVERARHLATQAREPAAHYEHVEAGFNYRMSNVLAGIGRGQLSVLADRVARRRAIFARYEASLARRPGVRFMPEPVWSRSTHWLTAATLDPAAAGCTRDELLAALSAQRIEARPTWKPMHMQPLFAGCRMFAHDPARRPVSQRLFEQGICLPSGSAMSDEDLARVAHTIESALSPARAAVA